MDHLKNYYCILGISSEAEDVVIRASYKVLSQKYHPDKFTGALDIATEKMAELNEAYSILSDPIKRKQYDLANHQSTKQEDGTDSDLDASGVNENIDSDPLYDEAVAIVLKSRTASISSIQHQLRIGYNRAARLIESMEQAGLVSPMQANGNREVLAPSSSSTGQAKEQTIAPNASPRLPDRNWRLWIFLYLVWVVCYLAFVNSFLDTPKLVTVSGNTLTVQSQQIPSAPLPNTQIPKLDDGVTLAAAAKLSTQGSEQAQKAFSILRPVADKGNPTAQYRLALMCFDGMGTAQSNEMGEFYLRKAAQQSLPDAMFDLATRLELGNGVQKDARAAKGWYAELQKKGDKRGDHALEKFKEDQLQPAMPQNEPDTFSKPSSETHPEASRPQNSEKSAIPNVVPSPITEPSYLAKFKGAFGKVEERRSYPTEEMRQSALDLWDKERKILEPDGSINEKHVPKKQGTCPIPGANC